MAPTPPNVRAAPAKPWWPSGTRGGRAPIWPPHPPTFGPPRQSRGGPREPAAAGPRYGPLPLFFRDDDDGVAAGLHAHAVADAEDAIAERAGQLHADELAGPDVDLVEVARALEDAEGDGARQAG